jgi:hypothetical protein
MRRKLLFLISLAGLSGGLLVAAPVPASASAACVNAHVYANVNGTAVDEPVSECTPV